MSRYTPHGLKLDILYEQGLPHFPDAARRTTTWMNKSFSNHYKYNGLTERTHQLWYASNIDKAS